jgi:hypothetical protein
MPIEDKALRRRVEHEIVRHGAIDMSLMTVSAINGVVTIAGRIRPYARIAGRGPDLRQEVGAIMDGVRSIPGVKDVVVSARFE